MKVIIAILVLWSGLVFANSDSLKILKNLHDQGLISDDLYYSKRDLITSSKEYKDTNKLYNDGVISYEELEEIILSLIKQTDRVWNSIQETQEEKRLIFENSFTNKCNKENCHIQNLQTLLTTQVDEPTRVNFECVSKGYKKSSSTQKTKINKLTNLYFDNYSKSNKDKFDKFNEVFTAANQLNYTEEDIQDIFSKIIICVN